MGLKKYNEKRDLTQSNEPAGKTTKSSQKTHIFVVQKHAASHLHYDFRLEVDGVLKSWAIPKGPTLDPSIKRLAMMVEDHPYDYHDFEGTIPEGNYGAGTVMVWDQGIFHCDNPREGLKKGDLKFVLLGEKLKGEFALVKMKKQTSNKDNQWLLLKKKDEYATKIDVLEQDRSVITGRNLDEITKNKTSKKKVSLSADSKRAKISKNKMPRNIKPMLAKLVESPFDGDEWLFETKWDGYRAISEVEDQEINLYSRSMQSFNNKYDPIIQALKALKTDAVFDGEIIVANEKGFADFQALQNYQHTGNGDLHYCLFDLLYHDGVDLRDKPLYVRKEYLSKLLKKSKSGILQFSEHILYEGKKVFKAVQKQDLEGMMAKKIHSTYKSTRSGEWVKVKTHKRQEAIICGFTEPKRGRKNLGSLVLGIFQDKELICIGHTGGGFNQETLKEVHQRLLSLATSKCPFKVKPVTNGPVTWVNPKLICEVSFAEWTDENHMRHPIFMGLRADKQPVEITKEKTMPLSSSKAQKPIKAKKPIKKEKAILTHLEKIYFPEYGYTKGDVLNYYREVAPFILPYLKDRPESLKRYPHGIEGDWFFQKNVSENFPEWIKTFEIEHSEKSVNYLLIQDIDSLLFAVNLGCVDINPLNSRTKTINNPDYLIIDLDPEDISFDKVVLTALEVHKVLEELNIPNYCKTSGATGMHILVPLAAKYSYETCKEFAHLLAQMVHDRIPEFTSLERKPKDRQKKVYIDFLQNNFGQTVAAPYCIRPRPMAPVSTPLEWNEVKVGIQPTDYTIKTTLQRLEKKGDIFKQVLGKGINIPALLKKLKDK